MLRRLWNQIPIGTRSILAGAHCFAIHPWFVAWAWIQLFGFPWDIRVWAAFFLHDLGYVGKANMDGEAGEEHVNLGALIMGALFDYIHTYYDNWYIPDTATAAEWDVVQQRLRDGGYDVHEYREFSHTLYLSRQQNKHYWENFTRYHSRYYAKKHGQPVSRLCYADKLALALTPWWIYLPLVNLSGEIHEYMELSKARTDAGEPKYASLKASTDSQKQWLFDVQHYIMLWVMEHCNGKEDTWTPVPNGGS